MIKISNDNFLSSVVFCDEAAFHLSGTANRHNVRITDLEKPHKSIDYTKDSPKVNVLHVVSENQVYESTSLWNGPLQEWYTITC
jgi:hypothetical protein